MTTFGTCFERGCHGTKNVGWQTYWHGESQERKHGPEHRALVGLQSLPWVRLALRAFDPEEQEAASTEKALANAADEERKQHAYRAQRRTDKFRKIRNALSVGEDIELDDTLSHKGLVSLAEKGLADAVRAELPAIPDVSALFEHLSELNSRRAARVDDRQKQENDAERKLGEAERLKSEA